MTDERPIVIVSNRGPLTFRLDDDGEPTPTRGAGGLVSGLLPLVTGTDTLWIAAAMGDADRRAATDAVIEAEGVRARLLAIDPDDFRAAYDVIGNATLWFVHHGLFDLSHRPRIDRHWRAAWEAYRRVNDAFADAVAESAPADSIVLVQDYHLALLAPRLADRRPDVTAIHFSHTPFAGPDLLHALPHDIRVELLEGLAAHHACGFHAARWARAFRHACEEDGVVPPTTFVAPLGPDPADLAASASAAACTAALERLDAATGDRQLIVRVDRLELSKNLVRGFLAFDTLLDEHPEHRGRVTFAASVYPSREGLPEYLAYRQEVEAVVRRVNERWGEPSWQPIVLDLSDDYLASVAALRAYDVLLVNPVRDGMNLVAKEGPLLNEREGTLVLSTEAGAADELAAAATMIDPCDIDGTAAALHAALTLPMADRSRRAGSLRSAISTRGPAEWLADQVAAAR